MVWFDRLWQVQGGADFGARGGEGGRGGHLDPCARSRCAAAPPRVLSNCVRWALGGCQRN